MVATFSTNTPYFELWHKAIAAVKGGHLDVREMKRQSSETAHSMSMKELAGLVPPTGRLTPEATVAKAA
jgi:hypothetical protein